MLTKGQWKALILAYDLYDTDLSHTISRMYVNAEHDCTDGDARLLDPPSASRSMIDRVVSKVRHSFRLASKDPDQHTHGQHSPSTPSPTGQHVIDSSAVIKSDAGTCMNDVCPVPQDVHDIVRYLFTGESFHRRTSPSNVYEPHSGCATRLARPLTSNEMYLLKRCSRSDGQARQHEARYQRLVASLSRLLRDCAHVSHATSTVTTNRLHAAGAAVVAVADNAMRTSETNDSDGEVRRSLGHRDALRRVRSPRTPPASSPDTPAGRRLYAGGSARAPPRDTHAPSPKAHVREGVSAAAGEHSLSYAHAHAPRKAGGDAALACMHVCEGCQEAGGDLFRCTQCYSVRHEICGGPHPPERPSTTTWTTVVSKMGKHREDDLLTPEPVLNGTSHDRHTPTPITSNDQPCDENHDVTGTGSIECEDDVYGNASSAASLTMLCRKCRHELRITNSSSSGSSHSGSSGSSSSSSTLRSSTSSEEREEIQAYFGSDADDSDTSLSGFIVDSDDASETSDTESNEPVRESKRSDSAKAKAKAKAKVKRQHKSMDSQSSGDGEERHRCRATTRRSRSPHGHRRRTRKRLSRRSVSYASSQSARSASGDAQDTPRRARPRRASPLSSSVSSCSASPQPSHRNMHTTPPSRDAAQETHILALSSSRSSTC